MMIKASGFGYAIPLAIVLLTSACNGDITGDINSPGTGGNNCANPIAASATQGSLTIPSPSDLDPTALPAPTTTIAYTLLAPRRCPGESFPLILHSHGFGGSRETALAANGTLQPGLPHFDSIDALARALPYHGYVVMSFDQRGHGASTNANARIIDPNAETQDARALLDWAYDNAEAFGIQRETSTGVARDLKVGTLGYSYGGGFQMPLAALDARIDTIVPNGTWHGLLYSLLPGDSMKLGYGGLLCLLATTGGVAATPVVQTLCNTIGITGIRAFNIRSRADLVNAAQGLLGLPLVIPRPVSETELISFFDTHGMSYFRARQLAGQPWGFGETSARLRPVPALFLQGNRDVLFNLTEAYWNQRYFSEAGGETRLISTEGGHMNPLVNQVEGTANCGAISGVDAILGWYDHHLKGQSPASYTALPNVCISVADTVGAPSGSSVGVRLQQFPVGSLSGAGAIPTQRASGVVDVPVGLLGPVFLPVTTITGNDKVLAGAPTIGSITITRGAPVLPLQSINGFVGVGIVRNGVTILVDDQITAFTEGTHTNNRNIAQDPKILLPAVGERLQNGDQVGLLLYPNNVQYAAIVSAQGLSGVTGIVSFIADVPIPPITSALQPVLGLVYINPYTASVSDVQLPILVPGTYAGSQLSQ